MGCYHGRHSFNQLSHLRSCLIKQLNMEAVNNMRYPPHTAKKMGWARFLLLKHVNVCRLQRMALLASLVGLAAFVMQVMVLIYTSAGQEGINCFLLVSVMHSFILQVCSFQLRVLAAVVTFSLSIVSQRKVATIMMFILASLVNVTPWNKFQCYLQLILIKDPEHCHGKTLLLLTHLWKENHFVVDREQHC